MQVEGQGPDFASIYAEPSIERLLNELSDDEFEDFVGYVFKQAGYIFEDTAHQRGPGLDGKLYLATASVPALHAGVQIKHCLPGHKVSAHEVVHLRGGLPEASEVTGYFVTTSSFNDYALREANHGRRIWTIDGAQFLRYITYVRSTRSNIAEDKESDARLRMNPLTPVAPEIFSAVEDITWRSPETTRVLTLANHKGGVGKTTSALNIAFGLAANDKQVLLVDMDPQANLSRILPSPTPGAADMDISDYFTHKHTSLLKKAC